MNPSDKPLVWLHGEVKTPPFSRETRVEAGYLLRRLQAGEKLSRIDDDAIVLLEVFEKQSKQTPRSVIEACKRRLRDYDS